MNLYINWVGVCLGPLIYFVLPVVVTVRLLLVAGCYSVVGSPQFITPRRPIKIKVEPMA